MRITDRDIPQRPSAQNAQTDDSRRLSPEGSDRAGVAPRQVASDAIDLGRTPSAHGVAALNLSSPDRVGVNVRQRLSEVEKAICCPMTLAPMQRAAQLPCGHSFDAESLATALRHAPSCPSCRAPVPAELARRSSEALPVNERMREFSQVFVACFPDGAESADPEVAAAFLSHLEGGPADEETPVPQQYRAGAVAETVTAPEPVPASSPMVFPFGHTLEGALRHPVWTMRLAAVRELARRGGAEAAHRLLDMATDADSGVRNAALASLRVLDPHRAARFLLMAPEASRRHEGLALLVQHPGEGASRRQTDEIVERRLSSRSWSERQAAVNALVQLSGPACGPRLLGLGTDPVADVRQAALTALQRLGLQHLAARFMLMAPDARSRHEGLALLVQHPGEGASRRQTDETVERWLTSRSWSERLAALGGLARLHGPAARARLSSIAASDPDADVRQEAAALAGRLGAAR